MLRISLLVAAAAVAVSSVKGSGTINFGASTEHYTINTTGSSGRVTFNDRTASGNVNGTIEVNCVRIVGNEATISGIVRQSNRKSIEGFEGLLQIRDNGIGRGKDDKPDKPDKAKAKDDKKDDHADHLKGKPSDHGTDFGSPILFHAVGTGSNCQVPGEFDLVPVKGDFTVKP